MVIERVELKIIEGKERDFEAAMNASGKALLAGAAGCSAVQLGRGVERPDRYLLILYWNSLESHMAFIGTPEFVEFRQVAAPYFAEKPAVEHFALVNLD